MQPADSSQGSFMEAVEMSVSMCRGLYNFHTVNSLRFRDTL